MVIRAKLSSRNAMIIAVNNKSHIADAIITMPKSNLCQKYQEHIKNISRIYVSRGFDICQPFGYNWFKAERIISKI